MTEDETQALLDVLAFDAECPNWTWDWQQALQSTWTLSSLRNHLLMLQLYDLWLQLLSLRRL